MTKIDLNKYPYFDDFDANTNYHKILFKPSVPVQARELSQLQTILQNQIEKFGDWAFQNGDIVTGCSITDIPSVPFVYIQDFASNGSQFDISNLANTIVTSTTSNLSAKVISFIPGSAAAYPNTNVLYVQYLNSGNNGNIVFQPNETLAFNHIVKTGNAAIDNVAVINSYSNTGLSNNIVSGNAHGISTTAGIVYVDGTFVTVTDPAFGIINAYGTYAANSVVGFTAQESIVNFLQDPSLCDNSQGFTNLNAPGADRLKIAPVLTTYASPNAIPNTVSFNPIATYNYGSLVVTSTSSNVYSIVNEAIASRIYDEAGNYVVNPFMVDAVSSVIVGNSVASNLTANQVLARVSPGHGYALGNQVELLRTSYIVENRGIDTQTQNNQQITFNYGNYLILQEVAGTFSQFSGTTTVSLYDTPQQAVTNKTFTNLNPVGNNIGTACVRCFIQASGVPGTNAAQYYLHLYNIQMSNSAVGVNQIASVYCASPKAVADVSVPGIQDGGIKNYFWTFGTPALQTLNSPNQTEFTFVTSSSTLLNVNGSIGVTLGATAPGGVNELPYGNGILPIVDSGNFQVIVTANTDANSSYFSGTVTVYSTNNTILGSGTNFVGQFQPGDQIKVNGSTVKTILSIANSTVMLVDSAFAANASAQAYIKTYLNGKILPLNVIPGGPQAYVNITNSSAFSIITNETPAAAIPINVIYPVLRTTAYAGTKQIKKNRFVVINVANNVGGPNGPWCLGYPDVHQVTAVYASSSNSFSTSSPNVLGSLVYGTGQTDAYYGYGYLYNTGSFNPTSTPWLLVELDYFASNTTSGYGFFSVDSYPIDDANTANTTAIQTKNIPVYVDSSGKQVWLRDVIDFRVPSVPSANDTGYCNTANLTSFSACVNAASVNPTRTVSFQVPGGGFMPPQYSSNFQASFSQYLGRYDLIMITPQNILKVKKGVAALAPQPPLYPDNAMVLSVLNIPPYPSLTSDEMDGIFNQNKNSITTVRNTSGYISSQLVSHRRYTMEDIGNLDSRITNLEYYAGMSQLQQDAQNIQVLDSNGLNAFKNGIFTDPCSSFAYCAVADPQFSIAVDSNLAELRPQFTREVVYIAYNPSQSTNTEATGRVITLNYTTIPYMVQQYATGYRSASLVSFQWNGTMWLLPAYDNHQDIINTGSINITVNNLNAWEQFAQSPAAFTWGDWVTVSNTSSSSVTAGGSSVNTYSVNVVVRGLFASQSQNPNFTPNVQPYIADIWSFIQGSLTFNGWNTGVTNASIINNSSQAYQYVSSANSFLYNSNSFTIGQIAVYYQGVPGVTSQKYLGIYNANGVLISNGTIQGS